MKKRIISFMLALAIVCSIVPIKMNALAAAGDHFGDKDWAWPVPSSNSISSCYLDIIGGHTNGHYALDIIGAHYADVVASYPGEVIWVNTACTEDYGKNSDCPCGQCGNLGKAVYIAHEYKGINFVSRYGHMASVSVSAGDYVSKGEIIGSVGSTGYSTGYHLDFKIYEGSSTSSSAAVSVDPLMDRFLELPSAFNANGASVWSTCCYDYVKEVVELYEKTNHISGQCGTNLTWTLDYAGTLTISGTGTMENYTYASSPWYSKRDSVKTVVIGDSVTSIGDRAFYSCDSLTTVTIGDSVTSIGDRAFYSCDSLTTVTIGDSVTSIGNGAFSWCSSLTGITIPDSVTSIGGSAFYSCDSLTKVTIGDSVTSIGGSAFDGCAKLTSVTIPDSVASIAADAFSDCYGLTAIWVNKNNANYSSDEKGVLFNKDKTELIQAPGGITGAYTIPDSVTSIGNSAFYWCRSLTGIIIPDGVISVGGHTFCNCDSLSSVTIPDSVTSIGNSAFSGCDSLTGITIPNSVTSIGDGAFNGCAKLTTVTIGESVTRIGSYAFSDCESLTSITIPNSVTNIGNRAFKNCDSLITVTIGECVTSIGYSAFSDCSKLQFNEYDNAKYLGNAENPYVALIETVSSSIISCKINEKTKIIGDEAFLYHKSLTTVTIPDSVTSIGNSAFSDCASLTTVILGDRVTNIGGYVFSNCTSLTSITIPDSVTSIDDSAFYRCSKLRFNVYDNAKYLGNAENPYVILMGAVSSSVTSCKINEKTKVIGDCAFAGCDSLTGINIPEGVKTIGEVAFAYCSNMTSVVIPNSVTSIVYRAFANCDSLTSVTIPESVESIEWCAFTGCDSLNGIWVEEDNAAYANDSRGVLFDKEMETLIQAPGGLQGSYAVPDGVKRISDSAFWGCDDLISVSISNDVTSIGKFAFSNCGNMTAIAIGDNVTQIGYEAFYNCSNLESIAIPVSVTSIGGDAFYDCTSLKDVYYSGTENQWSQISIGSDNNYLTSATIHYNHVHEYTSFPVTTVEPTCTAAGYREFICICGELYREVIPALDEHNFVDGVCSVCGAPERTPGDIDGSEEINTDDVIQLLLHVSMPGSFPIDADADFTGDGKVTTDDVIQLLLHVSMPEVFPLQIGK